MKFIKKITASLTALVCLAYGNIGFINYSSAAYTVDTIPPYSNQPYITLDNNIPDFDDADKTTTAFETYSELDSLGRCGVAYANVCEEIMPTGERGDISSITPTGWQSVKYDCVEGKYLYNRCHLIGYQLAGENANEKNLITGTRYMNIDGMLPFENAVDDYVEETDNHVLYRVTPDFENNNLVADGVQIEALSVEDNGEGICYNVYCYNVQPGVDIDYTTGISRLSAVNVKGDANGDGKLDIRDAAFIASSLSKGKSLSTIADYNGDGTVNVRDAAAIAKYLAKISAPVVTKPKVTTATKPTTPTTTTVAVIDNSATYVLNTNSKKFHYPYCSSAKKDIRQK